MAAPCLQTSRAAGLPGPRCTWKRVGREGSVALGQRGEIQPTLSTLLINLPRGDQRGEARSNTSEEEPRGREDESFGLNEIFQKLFKKNFFLQALSSLAFKNDVLS